MARNSSNEAPPLPLRDRSYPVSNPTDSTPTDSNPTDSTPIEDDEMETRAIILFSLVVARRLLRHAKWSPAVRARVHDKIVELIEEYKNPNAG